MDIYVIGSRRIRRKFIFRKTVNGETRWLQIARWEEEFVNVFVASFDDYCEWRATRWLTSTEHIDMNPNKVQSVGWS